MSIRLVRSSRRDQLVEPQSAAGRGLHRLLAGQMLVSLDQFVDRLGIDPGSIDGDRLGVFGGVFDGLVEVGHQSASKPEK